MRVCDLLQDKNLAEKSLGNLARGEPDFDIFFFARSDKVDHAWNSPQIFQIAFTDVYLKWERKRKIDGDRESKTFVGDAKGQS